MPYYNLSNNGVIQDNHSPKSLQGNDCENSTPSTLQRPRSHFYTNAAPSKVEGNVFRYDFDEQVNAFIY